MYDFMSQSLLARVRLMTYRYYNESTSAINKRKVKHRARVRFSSLSMASFNLILLNNHIHGDQNQEKKTSISIDQLIKKRFVNYLRALLKKLFQFVMIFLKRFSPHREC